MIARRHHLVLPLLAVAAVVNIGGCPPRGSAHVPEVSPAMAEYAAKTWPQSDPLQLQRGRALLTSGRCSECHGQPGPQSESAKEWPGVAQSMGRKAKFTQAEREDLLRFVLAARSDRR
jgi:hypothetical protein